MKVIVGSLKYWVLVSWLLSAPAILASVTVVNDEEQTCTWEERATCGNVYRDPHLKPLQVTLNGDKVDETFYAYVPPDFSTYYNASQGSMKPIETSFSGMFGKFINLSNKRVQIYWQPRNKKLAPTYISDIAPFGAAGTATYPQHAFIVTEPNKPTKILDSFSIKSSHSLYTYDPYGTVEQAAKVLTPEELDLYKLQYRNLEFNKLYKRATGREWLALYGRKYAPRYPMWPADFFNQTFTVTTKETYIERPVPDDIGKKKIGAYGTSLAEREQLEPYRSTQDMLTLNMTVLSVAPRAYEIRNFLSDEEVHHILELATGMKLSRSTTKAGTMGTGRTDDSTRTSLNSWIGRERSPIVDVVFRRAADLLQIDEACFRYRRDDEKQLVEGSMAPISERLQLVHYDVGQQYTPHHVSLSFKEEVAGLQKCANTTCYFVKDFSVPDLKDGQTSRFATILFYLNEGMEGGETSFPRWLNAKTSKILKVKPEVGKAILFYNQLPDGNYDERSQHAALPVVKGEKWLTNLWVWVSYLCFQHGTTTAMRCIHCFNVLAFYSLHDCCQDPYMSADI